MRRLGLRTRLSLIYSGLFFAAGALLVWFIYLFNARTITTKIVGPKQVNPASADVLFDQLRGVENNVRGEMLRTSIVILVIVGLIALVIGYFIADRALRPLDLVTETARRLSESTLHERIGLQGPDDEVKKLADTFDALLDRLHRAFDNQRRFIANASHELRTPLAINRTVLEVSLEEPGSSEDLRTLARTLLNTNARYERLIEGLLLLAESSEELGVRRPVELSAVVKSALDQLDLARKRSVAVHRDLAGVTVEGDPLLLERAVFNVLENAVKYNHRDGQVWVTLDADGTLVVENTGPAVAPYEVEDLFEPFRRAQGDRLRSGRGAGLGLSIVRAITDAHGGTASAQARAEGGLTVGLALPPLRL